MDVRIGIAESPQVIEVDMEGEEREAFKTEVEDAIAGKAKVLWVTDRKGRQLAVPAEKIGYVEIGSADAERRIGFGA